MGGHLITIVLSSPFIAMPVIIHLSDTLFLHSAVLCYSPLFSPRLDAVSLLYTSCTLFVGWIEN